MKNGGSDHHRGNINPLGANVAITRNISFAIFDHFALSPGVCCSKLRRRKGRIFARVFLGKFYDCVKFKGITTRNGKIAEVEISRELETKRAPLKTLAQRVQPTALPAFLIEKINNSRGAVRRPWPRHGSLALPVAKFRFLGMEARLTRQQTVINQNYDFLPP